MYKKTLSIGKRILSSPYLTVALMFYAVFLIFVATLAQKYIPVDKVVSDYFESFFYVGEINNVPVFLIGGASVGILAVVNIFFSCMRYMSYGASALGNSIIHCGLVLLIVSGALQACMKEEISVPLREGQTSNIAYKKISDSSSVESFELPFSITLVDFKAEYWQGSDIPKSYSSKVVFKRGSSDTEALIQMNNPVSFNGWVFYQTSFADGGNVSTLTGVRNPARMLPWLAVFAVFVGMIFTMIVKLKRYKR